MATLSESMLQHARSIGDSQAVLPALVWAAEAAEMQGDERVARQLMEESEAALHAHPLLASESLRDAVRLSVAQGATETDLRSDGQIGREGAILDAFSKRCLQASRAVVAEAQGLLEEGLSLHKEAAQHWEEFGIPLERDHALQGVGRSLIALVTARPQQSRSRRPEPSSSA